MQKENLMIILNDKYWNNSKLENRFVLHGKKNWALDECIYTESTLIRV